MSLDPRRVVAALGVTAPATDPKTGTARTRVGVVTSVGAGTVSLTLGGDTTVLTGVRHLAHYKPAVGDVVSLLQDGTSLLVVGRLAPGSLPDQQITSGGGSVTATAAGTILTGTSTLSITLAAPALVAVNFGGYIALALGTAGQMGLVASGATTIAFSNSTGYAIYAGSPAGVTAAWYTQHSASRNLTIAAGTTTFQVQAYKTGAGTCSINFGYLEVTPLRWA